jgi:hypothetical protein
VFKTIRAQLRDLIGAASSLDGDLAEADPARVPDLDQAAAAVELDKIGARLDKVAKRLAAAGRVAPPRRPARASGPRPERSCTAWRPSGKRNRKRNEGAEK